MATDEFVFDGVTVPSDESPPATPSTSHAIAVPGGTQREAAKTCIVLIATLAVAGDNELEEAQVIVTLAESELDGSATLVAVTLTVGREGTVEGAV